MENFDRLIIIEDISEFLKQIERGVFHEVSKARNAL
jgi:hypothetical protein